VAAQMMKAAASLPFIRLKIPLIVIIDFPLTLVVEVSVQDVLKRAELIVKVALEEKKYVATVKGWWLSSSSIQGATVVILKALVDCR
jgi:hypothetical protein